MSVYGTIEYISNFTAVIPIAIGGWVGSFITIKYLKYKSEKNSKGGD